MTKTCFGLAYCCHLKKTCEARDNKLKELGITKSEYTKLKKDFDKGIKELLKRKND